MKLTIFLGALVLSASPTIADDLLYLKCKAELTSEATNTETSEIIQKNKGKYSKTFIFDRERRRMMSKGGQWLNADIIDGVVTSSGKIGQGFSTTEETFRISIAPVGEYVYQQSIRQGRISMEIDAIGTCEEIDAEEL
jgi:hypothetical protein